MYQSILGNADMVRRVSDGAFVPATSIEAAQWLAAGNVLIAAEQPSLVDAKASAYAHIDAAAGKARAKYLTVCSGQDATYLLKAADADLYKAAGYPAAQIASYPWVRAKAASMVATPAAADYQAAADLIIATRDTWVAKGAAIEEARETGKRLVSAATTVAAVATAKDAALAALAAL